METLESDTYGELKKQKITNVWNIYAPIKTKLLRFNNNVFMTKELRTEIFKRSKLRKNLIETEIIKIGAILNFRGTTV